MPPTRGYAARKSSAKLEPFAFERRAPGPRDMLIEILYYDIHQTRDEWGGRFRLSERLTSGRSEAPCATVSSLI